MNSDPVFQIKLVEGMKPSDWEYLTLWKDRVFQEEGIGIKWSQSKWHVLAYPDGPRPIAHIGFSDFEVLLDDDVKLNVIGVGGVVVRPEYQGQGIPLILFEHLHNSLLANTHSDTFTLLCPHRLESYYKRYGYKAFHGSVIFMQDDEKMTSDKFVFMYRGATIDSSKIHLMNEPW